MKNIALFFGAGAEIAYGLPSGGKFALDIFRENTEADKNKLREQIRKVDTTTHYALWLPKDFENKRINAFSKTQYDSLVKGSLENKRYDIIQYMKNFDINVRKIVSNIQMKENNNINIDLIYEELTGKCVGDSNYGQRIALNRILGDDLDQVFSSDYFAVLLDLLLCERISSSLKMNLLKIIRNILELLIGALGEELTHRLNDGIFEKSPDIMDLFDDLGSIFSLDYNNSGMRGLELLIEHEIKDLSKINIGDKEDIIFQFGLRILEDIFSKALDYQTLIDTNWRYIYHPNTDWTKFTKIIIFLNTVQRYIKSLADKNIDKIDSGNGYYHDVKLLKNEFNITGIGTSNYNIFIRDIIQEEVFFLNGCVDDCYDPYLNKIVTEEENKEKNHILVPFLFTQSGIKPLTSVQMSKRYVALFDKFEKADIICVCGFSFNSDDGHINGMFRELIDDKRKKVVILHYYDAENNKQEIKKTYRKKLRLNSVANIEIIIVDDNRYDIEKKRLWFESLKDM